uniref:Uncharacterized protein n=1 Tax=Avena sativa TaxID=4498 RepID=A0ACD5YZ05_AVESA
MPMMNVLSGHRHYVLQPHRVHHHHHRHPRRTVTNSPGQLAVTCDPRSRMGRSSSSFRHRGAAVRAVIDGGESGSGKDDDDDAENNKKKADDLEASSSPSSKKDHRADLERLVGSAADASFSGLDLATLIRERYGRSYDVTLIRKEFMGRNLLAMNVMWKYREQRSFPLTEEEYLLRLDDVANTLRCWGAVAHVRNTLQKVRERPRIGKAVSIFIDMDTTGGARSDEWIYK